MAARAGALTAEPEFVQFNTTAVDVGRDPAPRATEALRGDGAVIVDREGKRFMREYHPDGELAPRDVVARAVHDARVSGRGAFLDCSDAIGRDFAEHFPTVYAACITAGLDPAVEPIPIAPAAHYHMGGVHVDSAGRTTLDGLWACGEVAATGAHGANRLASNSLLEAVVFAARVAEDIHGMLPSGKVTRWSGMAEGEAPTAPEEDDELMRLLRATMSRHVGVVRDGAGLREALDTINELAARALTPAVRNALVAAKLIAAAALQREESRGGHFRSDYPASNPALASRTFLTLEDANAVARAASPAGMRKSALA
jgi:L-aspartate oxidase